VHRPIRAVRPTGLTALNLSAHRTDQAAARGTEPQLATTVLNSGPGAALICWEHSHIPALASALPLASGTVIM
jgi:hypothetical protein